MEDSTIEAECPECGEKFIQFSKFNLLKMDRKLKSFARKNSSKELAEEVREINPDAEIEDSVTSPSLNNMGMYEIDTNKPLSSIDFAINDECICGISYEIHVETDYSRPITVDLELKPE